MTSNGQDTNHWRGYKPKRDTPTTSERWGFWKREAAGWEIDVKPDRDFTKPPGRDDFDVADDGEWEEFEAAVEERIKKWRQPRANWNIFIDLGNDDRLLEFLSMFGGSATRLAQIMGEYISAGILIKRLDGIDPDWRELRRELLIDYAFRQLYSTMDAEQMNVKHRLTAAKMGLDYHARREAKRMELDHEAKLRAATKRLAEYEKDDEDRVAKLSNDEAMVKEAPA